MVKLINFMKLQQLLIIIISLLFCGCPHDVDDVQIITIVNNSSEKLVFYNDQINESEYDTVLVKKYPWEEEVADFYIVHPQAIKEIVEVKSNLEFILSNNWYQLYFFNCDSVQTIPWQRIRDEYIVAKRVDFESWEELEECNFTITYP